MKPYVICLMISSIDGRIDCDMVEKLPGNDEYVLDMEKCAFDACISGKTTAILHYAVDDKFVPTRDDLIESECFCLAKRNVPYLVVTDTHGKLRWDKNEIDGSHLVIATSLSAPKDYLDYLTRLGISYIATGEKEIDLVRMCEILHDEFGVKRLGLTGGGNINGAFLEGGLIDEIHLILSPGIDGRKGFCALFDGLPLEKEPSLLRLKGCEAFENGSVLLTYSLA